MFIKKSLMTLIFSENLQKSLFQGKMGYFWAHCTKEKSLYCTKCTIQAKFIAKLINMLYPSKPNVWLFRRSNHIYLKFLPDLRAYNVSQRR